MSNPQIKITETRSFTSSRSNHIDIQSVVSSQLPQAPLVSFDLHFDTLKVKYIQDYLNNVTAIVNQQGSVLKTIIEELKTRVTTTDILEIFSAVSGIIPHELGKVTAPKTGDD